MLGSGPAGTALARELARRGHPVRLVDRKGEGRTPGGVRRYTADGTTADVATADGARAATAGAAVVYHRVDVTHHPRST
ncbi:hypothetical protein BU52_27570 [Streptomyces toyocaensis]|uniref:Uncharacterized protein n=1 Tax=Streptomyces toyocaensis TaxID=55952 RepID=A0A081XKG7_STRTO|nr:hypothetical protein BU52_27570 [Streptomyces toyocaensis]